MECSKLLRETLNDPRFKYMGTDTEHGNSVIGSFNGKMVRVDQYNTTKPGHFTVDTSDFMSGSGDGKQFYNMIWDWADENNMKYDIIPDGLTFVNKYRLAANVLDRFRKKPKTTSINKTEAKELIDRAIYELDVDLRFEGIPNGVKNLSKEEIELFGDIFGSDSNKRVGRKSLKAFQDYARGAISLSALLAILTQGDNEWITTVV